MSAYGNNRRTPNVLQYLRSLQEESPVEETLYTQAEIRNTLELYTNTEFFDYDLGTNKDYKAQPDTHRIKPESVAQLGSTDVTLTDVLGEFDPEYPLSVDFGFADFGSAYTSPITSSFPDSLGNLQSLGTTDFHQPVSQCAQRQPGYSAPAAQPLDARNSEATSPTAHGILFDEQSRRLAEEDKRRRNTAASARFRVKKKQREQALEKQAREMNDKVSELEGRINALETENKFLRSLIMEKHGERELKKLLDPKVLGKLVAGGSSNCEDKTRSKKKTPSSKNDTSSEDEVDHY